MNCKDLLMRLSSAVGVSGREGSVVAMAAEELRALGEVSAFFMYPFDWLRGGCSSDTAFGADGNAAP